jgi:hypothetical protein
MSNIDDHQIFWLGAEATTYAVPCERCREEHRFSDVIEAMVEGTLRRPTSAYRLPPRPPTGVRRPRLRPLPRGIRAGGLSPRLAGRLAFPVACDRDRRRPVATRARGRSSTCSPRT